MASRDLFEEAVVKRYALFQHSLQRFVFNLMPDGSELTAMHAMNLEQAIEQLMVVVADPAEQPEWLKSLRTMLAEYLRTKGSDFGVTKQLSLFLQSTYDSMMNHDWGLMLQGLPEAPNVDRLLFELYSVSGVEQKFDFLIEKLQELIETEIVDSNSAVKSLRKLIALVKRNKRTPIGAYFSLRSVSNFVTHYLDILAQDPKAPALLKPITAALRATIRDAHTGVTNVFDEASSRVNDVGNVPVLHIEQKKYPGLPPIDNGPDDEIDGEIVSTT